MADFPRVKPSGWGTNETLTSAEITQLDIDHVSSLNRAGGNITGIVSVQPAAKITIDGGDIQFNSGNLIGPVDLSSTITCAAGAGITATGTGFLRCQGGADLTITGAGSTIVTASGGRLVLGDADFPVLTPARTTTIRLLPGATALRTMADSSGIVGFLTQLGSGHLFVLEIPLAALVGATISSMTLTFIPSTSYAGDPAPATQVSMAAFRIDPATGAVESLNSTTYTSYATPADGNAYSNSGIPTLQTLTHSVNQNATISNTYKYIVRVVGEVTPNFQTGTEYLGVTVNITNITELRSW